MGGTDPVLANLPLRVLNPICRALQHYHHHQVVGLENVPESGPVLLVSSHSLATYDSMLLARSLLFDRGRLAWTLVDSWFFKLPFIRELVPQLNWVEASPEAGRQILESGEILLIFPGGMREALRSSQHKHEICWDGRFGFARLAIQAQVPVILVTCPNADDIFEVYETPLTDKIYSLLKLPFVAFRGIGPTVVPRPAKLTHWVSEPIQPPKPKSENDLEPMIESFHHQLTEKMQELIAKASKPDAPR